MLKISTVKPNMVQPAWNTLSALNPKEKQVIILSFLYTTRNMKLIKNSMLPKQKVILKRKKIRSENYGKKSYHRLKLMYRIKNSLIPSKPISFTYY